MEEGCIIYGLEGGSIYILGLDVSTFQRITVTTSEPVTVSTIFTCTCLNILTSKCHYNWTCELYLDISNVTAYQLGIWTCACLIILTTSASDCRKISICICLDISTFGCQHHNIWISSYQNTWMSPHHHTSNTLSEPLSSFQTWSLRTHEILTTDILTTREVLFFHRLTLDLTGRDISGQPLWQSSSASSMGKLGFWQYQVFPVFLGGMRGSQPDRKDTRAHMSFWKWL